MRCAARPAKAKSASRARAELLPLLCALACGGHGEATNPPANKPFDPARVEAMLVVGSPLPARAEAVSEADAVAIAASREGKTPAGGALAALAARLRERLFRFDHAGADAREAVELLGLAATQLAGKEEGCRADRRRAELVGEMSQDAAVSYRELYVAARRQAAIAARSPDRAASPCVAGLEAEVASAIAFRPEGEAMRALEALATAAIDAAEKGAIAPTSSSPPAAPSGSSATPPSAAANGDVVIAPREDTLPSGPVKLVGVQPFGSPEGARIVLELSGPASFQVGTLAADDAAGKDARLYLDLAKATSKGIKREIEVGGAVRRVRVGAHATGTRVVVDMAQSLHRRIFFLPDPFRVVIDVSSRAPTTDTSAAGSARTIARVVLDPGHGGNDTGAVGPTGLREKDVTLDIAHRAAPLLAHELKVETLLTRDDDTYVPLDLRTARANAFHGDLFVSIHCNASETGAARGVQTFVLDEAKENSAARVAARENSPRAKALASLTPKDPADLSLVLANLNVGDLQGRSRHFADLLQRSALGSLGERYPDTKDQGIKSAGFFVLVGADMPATLFETAFISNPEDETRLATADFRQKLADAIVNAVKAYKAGK